MSIFLLLLFFGTNRTASYFFRSVLLFSFLVGIFILGNKFGKSK